MVNKVLKRETFLVTKMIIRDNLLVSNRIVSSSGNQMYDENFQKKFQNFFHFIMI